MVAIVEICKGRKLVKLNALVC